MPYNYDQDDVMRTLAFDIMDWYESRHLNNIRDTQPEDFPRPPFLTENYLQTLNQDQRAEVENIINEERNNALRQNALRQNGGKRKRYNRTKSKRSKNTKSKRSKYTKSKRSK